METFIFHRSGTWDFKSRVPADIPGEDRYLLRGGGREGEKEKV